MSELINEIADIIDNTAIISKDYDKYNSKMRIFNSVGISEEIVKLLQKKGIIKK